MELQTALNTIVKRSAQAVLTTSLLMGSNLVLAENNPLATADQLELDQKSISIFENYAFTVLRAKASVVYKVAYGVFVSDEAKPSLEPMIDELVFSSIQKSVNNDIYHPKVYWVDTAPRSWFNINVPGGRYSYDNPDVIYRTIPIGGDFHYVLHGKRNKGGVVDATFSLISNPNSQKTVSLLTNSDLVVNADGTYDITIDSEPANGRVNHIQSNSSAVQLFVRNTLGNWQKNTPDSLSIEILEDMTGYPERSDTRIYMNTLKTLSESIFFYGVGALGIKTKTNAVNTFKQPEQSDDLGTLVTQASSFGHFKIEDDEALVLTINAGGAGYFVVPATNPWTITVSPGTIQCSLNNTQAIADSDGLYRFVISRTDPGVLNWISSSDMHEGTMMLRWQNLPTTAPASGPASVNTQLVKLADLPATLPTDTVWVTNSQRQSQLQNRLQGYARRAVN